MTCCDQSRRSCRQAAATHVVTSAARCELQHSAKTTATCTIVHVYYSTTFCDDHGTEQRSSDQPHTTGGSGCGSGAIYNIRRPEAAAVSRQALTDLEAGGAAGGEQRADGAGLEAARRRQHVGRALAHRRLLLHRAPQLRLQR